MKNIRYILCLVENGHFSGELSYSILTGGEEIYQGVAHSSHFIGLDKKPLIHKKNSQTDAYINVIPLTSLDNEKIRVDLPVLLQEDYSEQIEVPRNRILEIEVLDSK